MPRALWLIALLPGCIEYTPASRLPDPGIANPRALGPEHQIDSLVQMTEPEVDVLWLVDNSSSMGEEQDGIAANFPVFLDFFEGSGLDWHIGVISTDIYDPNHRGRLVQKQGVRWIQPDTQNPEEILSEMARLGVSGSGDERGRDPIFMALDELRDTYNAGFYRESAQLHVIAISDEEDSSDRIAEEEFLTWMESLKPQDEDLTFSAIVSPDPICPTANDPGVEYIRYQQRLGGIFWPICNTDWATVLELLGIQSAGLTREYYLSQLPVPDSIQVYVIDDGVTFPFVEGEDWDYQPVRNSILFHAYVPAPLARIHIEYDVYAAQ